jgi:hypothetical protein
VHQFHHFERLKYALDTNLQSNKKEGMKWKDRTELFSPQLAKSVHLILSLTTGCVSTQFHGTFHDAFAMLQDYNIAPSLW